MRDASWGTPWVAHGVRRPAAALRLFCLPCAGGSASAFRHWADALGPEIEVCPIELPGRGTRLGDAPHRELDPLVDAMVEGIEPLLDVPFAFLGHSFGGLVAFLAARDLHRHGQAPRALIVAGTPAPHILRTGIAMHRLPDATLQERLATLKGIPPAVAARPWLLESFLPVVRADLEALETYVHAPSPPIPCRLAAFWGTEDAEVPEAAILPWRAHTAGLFSSHAFPDGHFFLHAAGVTVPERVGEILRAQ